MAQLTIEKAQTLLGRSLTTAESNAFGDWEAIAESRLADLLCVQDMAKLLEILGVDSLPTELLLVLARLTVAIGVENGVEVGVSSKKVEDFSITYDNDRKNYYANTLSENGATIMKYSQCSIRYGRTLKEEARYYHNDRF